MGMAESGSPGYLPEKRQSDPGEHVNPHGAAHTQDETPGFDHVRLVRVLAENL